MATRFDDYTPSNDTLSSSNITESDSLYFAELAYFKCQLLLTEVSL